MSQVKINEGVLWVGGEAYPLRNISHVAQRRLTLDAGKAWKDFFIISLAWLIVGGIIAAIFDVVGTIILMVVEGLVVWSLVNDLRKPPLYGLILNTSGTQFDAVWSTRQSEIKTWWVRSPRPSAVLTRPRSSSTWSTLFRAT